MTEDEAVATADGTVATGNVEIVDAPESLPVDELVPVCGASKQNYVCVRPPDHPPEHDQIVHLSVTDRGMIVQWIEGEPGVKIRPMTMQERAALEGMEAEELAEDVAMFGEIIIGKLDVSPGDVVVVRAPESWGIEAHRQYMEALSAWSNERELGLHWLVMPASTDLAVLHPDTVVQMDVTPVGQDLLA
jgi:hypothetical protein